MNKETTTFLLMVLVIVLLFQDIKTRFGLMEYYITVLSLITVYYLASNNYYLRKQRTDFITETEVIK